MPFGWFFLFYRPPSSSERSIPLLADAMSSVSYDFLVLGGEFKLPDMTCEKGKSSKFPDSLTYSTFNNFITSFALQLHVVPSTRIGLERASTLALLFIWTFNDIFGVRSS